MRFKQEVVHTEKLTSLHTSAATSFYSKITPSTDIEWTYHLSDRIKRYFIQGAAVAIQLYECSTMMLTKYIEKKLNKKDKRMIQADVKNQQDMQSTAGEVRSKSVLMIYPMTSLDGRSSTL